MCTNQTLEIYKDLRDKVLFVGSAVGMGTKVMLPGFLRAAASALDVGLDDRQEAAAAEEGSSPSPRLIIMGKGWEALEDFKPFAKGILPQVSGG